jgi:hypothetical protein
MTDRQLAAETVSAANLRPHCKEEGFASELFNFDPGPLIIKVAACTFTNVETLIKINDYPILSINPPADRGQPFLLSGSFSDSTGETTLTIADNVWSVGADGWDVEIEGPRITVRRGLGDIALIVRTEPPHNLVIERIDMALDGMHLKGDESEVLFGDEKGWAKLRGYSSTGSRVGISLNNKPKASRR